MKSEQIFLPFDQETEIEDLLSDDGFSQLDPYLTHIGYFSVEERGKRRNLSKRLSVTLKGKNIRVELNALGKYDLPRTNDLDKYLAFVKILNNRIRANGTLANPIPLRTSELLREVRLKNKYGGDERRSVREWFGRLRSTEILCEYDGDGETPDLTLMTSVFHRVIIRGEKYEEEKSNTNLIWMDDVLLNKFNARATIPFDYEGYKRLNNPTAKTLFPLLTKWLYSSRSKERFEKNYDGLTEILGIVRYHSKSDIERQLEPGMTELLRHGWLEKFQLESNNRGGYKVCLMKGERYSQFLNIYERRRSFVSLPGKQNNLGATTPPLLAQKGQASALKLVTKNTTTSPPGQSRFTFEQWLAYAKTQPNLNNPVGFADKAYSTGSKDHILEAHLADSKETEKRKVAGIQLAEEDLKLVLSFCPQCFGSSLEVVPEKGARRCHHAKLTVKILKAAVARGELKQELLDIYLEQARSSF